MSVTWIDGRAVAKKWKENAAQRAQALIQKGITPHLAVIVAGENPASQVYVRNKENACSRAGIRSTVLRLPETCTQEELVNAVLALNADDSLVSSLALELPNRAVFFGIEAAAAGEAAARAPSDATHCIRCRAPYE